MSKRIILNETSYFGKGAIKEIINELQSRHFQKILVTTGEDLLEFGVATKVTDLLRDAGINFEVYTDIKPNPTIENIKNGVDVCKRFDAQAIVAIGGGSIIDAVKLMANTLDLTYITVPSTLSNDAIYSPIARLLKDGKKQSFGVKAPLGIIADVNIIKGSPEKLLLAGVGDLVSNASAVKDWYLAHIDKGESINNFAMALASLSGNSVIPYTFNDIRSSRFIGDLANGLVISGLAMVLANSSRPASGAEHMISHAIDDLFPNRSTLHGLQVAWGHLLVERDFRKPENDYEKLMIFFERMKILDEIERNITFSNGEIDQIINRAKTIRNRYTILTKA